MPSPCVPPGKKQFGECSRIPSAYSPKVVRTNEIAKLVITTLDFPYNMLISIQVSIPFFERVARLQCHKSVR